MVEERYKAFKNADGAQPMDAAKGVQRIVDVVKGEWLAAGREMPLTLYLGSDVVGQVRERAERTLEELRVWEDMGTGLET